MSGCCADGLSPAVLLLQQLDRRFIAGVDAQGSVESLILAVGRVDHPIDRIQYAQSAAVGSIKFGCGLQIIDRTSELTLDNQTRHRAQAIDSGIVRCQ